MYQLINNQRPQSPCRDCRPPERFLGCHAVCPEYKSFRTESDLAAMRIREKKAETYEYKGYRSAKRYGK